MATDMTPPRSAYSRGVSFDTFDNRDATLFSLTLNYKHRNFKSSRRSRTYLCGLDANDYSEFALEWLIDELVEDGDEIVCLRVVDRDSVDAKRYHGEGKKLFDSVIAKMGDKKSISLAMELAAGKVQELIQNMIEIYEPAALVVGTRGRSLGGVQGLLPGSVSKYCLEQSPVPVIVVRPSSMREKKKQKRAANTTREKYEDVLRINDAKSGKIFDASMDQAKHKSTAAASASPITTTTTLASDDISTLTTSSDHTTTVSKSSDLTSSGRPSSVAKANSSSSTPVQSPKRPPLAASTSASVITTKPFQTTTLTRSNSTHDGDEADKVADAIGIPLTLRRLERENKGRGRANSLPVVPTVKSFAKNSEEPRKHTEAAATDAAVPAKEKANKKS